MSATSTHRVRLHRQKLLDAGSRRLDVILSREAKAALAFLVDDGEPLSASARAKAERDTVNGALLALAKLKGFSCD